MPRQRIVIYSIDGLTESVYATAYGDEEAGRMLIACLCEHGPHSQPEIADARSFWQYAV
jgi:hypothetical protein